VPQIEQISEYYASQIFWLLIAFGLIYAVIGRAMLPKITATVDLRARTVSDDLAAAETARRAADATEEAWRTKIAAAKAEARAETEAAKARAIAAAELRVKAADAEANARLMDAEAAIRSAADAASTSIAEAASSAAQEIVVKLSGATVTPDAASVAVQQAMANG